MRDRPGTCDANMIQFWCRCCDHGWREDAATGSQGPTVCRRCQAHQVLRYAVEPPKPDGFVRRDGPAAVGGPVGRSRPVTVSARYG